MCGAVRIDSVMKLVANRLAGIDALQLSMKTAAAMPSPARLSGTTMPPHCCKPRNPRNPACYRNCIGEWIRQKNSANPGTGGNNSIIANAQPAKIDGAR